MVALRQRVLGAARRRSIGWLVSFAATTAILVSLAASPSAAASPNLTAAPIWVSNPTGSSIPPLAGLLPDVTPPTGGEFEDSAPVVAMDPSGAATAAWIDSNDRLAVSSLDPTTGSWSEAQELGEAGGCGDNVPTVTMDAAGDSFVAWCQGSESGGAQVNFDYSPGMRPTSWTHAASGIVADYANVYGLDSAVNDEGELGLVVSAGRDYWAAREIVLFTGNFVNGVFGPTDHAGGSFNTGLDLSDATWHGIGFRGNPSVSIDSSGDVVAAWSQRTRVGSDGHNVEVSFDPAANAFPTTDVAPSNVTPVTLGSGAGPDIEPTLAMNPHGDAAVAWTAAVSGSGTTTIDEADATLSQLESPGGAQFTGAVAIDPSGGQSEDEPTIAVGADGTTALAWDDETSDTVDALVRPAGDFGDGGWTTADEFASDSSSSCSASEITACDIDSGGRPAIALQPDDAAVLAWSDEDSGVDAAIHDSGSWSPPQRLEYGDDTAPSGTDSTQSPAEATLVSLAVDAGGDAVATWASSPGAGSQAAVSELDSGSANEISVPGELTAGDGASMSVTISDTWLWSDPVSTTWSFGDGSSATGESVSHVYAQAGTYTVTVTTTNGQGASQISTVTVTVSAPSGTTTTGDTTTIGGTATVSGTTTAGETTPTGTSTGQTTTTATPSADTVTPPVLAKSAITTTSSGTVYVKRPGSNKFIKISSSENVPNGSVVNATHGTVVLTVALPDGKTVTGQFWGGEFELTQTKTGAVNLKLVGGSFAACTSKTAQARAARAGADTHAAAAKAQKKKKKKKKPKIIRELWSNAHGKFKTTGKYGSAAVLGTEWLTRDQCNGSYFFVKKTSNDPHGEIRVTVLYPHRHTVLLKRGHSLLAPAPSR